MTALHDALVAKLAPYDRQTVTPSVREHMAVDVLNVIAAPTEPQVANSEPRDDRIAEAYGSFDPWAALVPSWLRACMAHAAVKACDMHAAKALHPSHPGWDGFKNGGPVPEVPDDGTVTDPHARWSTYDHPAGDAA